MKDHEARSKNPARKCQLAFYSQIGDENFDWDIRIRDKATALYIFAGWQKGRDK